MGVLISTTEKTARCPPCWLFWRDKHICLLRFFVENAFSSEVSTVLSLRLERYQPMWEEGPFDECAFVTQ